MTRRLRAEEPKLRIGDLAKVTGKSARALRLYEEMGLLQPGDRSSGNFRLYDRSAVERVAWISKLQDVGLTLADIRAVVDNASRGALPREGMAEAKRVFEEQLGEVQTQRARLRELEEELVRALAFLDGCVGCGQKQQVACQTCDEQTADAPSLVTHLNALRGAPENSSAGEDK